MLTQSTGLLSDFELSSDKEESHDDFSPFASPHMRAGYARNGCRPNRAWRGLMHRDRGCFAVFCTAHVGTWAGRSS